MSGEGFYDTYQDYLKVPLWTSGRGYWAGELVLYSGSVYRCVTNNSDAVFTPVNWAAVGASLFAVEQLSVTDGSPICTLSHLPVGGAVQIMYNGAVQIPGDAYTVSGQDVIFTWNLTAGDTVIASFNYTT